MLHHEKTHKYDFISIPGHGQSSPIELNFNLSQSKTIKWIEFDWIRFCSIGSESNSRKVQCSIPKLLINRTQSTDLARLSSISERFPDWLVPGYIEIKVRAGEHVMWKYTGKEKLMQHVTVLSVKERARHIWLRILCDAVEVTFRWSETITSVLLTALSPYCSLWLP